MPGIWPKHLEAEVQPSRFQYSTGDSRADARTRAAHAARAARAAGAREPDRMRVAVEKRGSAEQGRTLFMSIRIVQTIIFVNDTSH